MVETLDANLILLAADAASNPLTASGLWDIIQTFFRAVGGIIVVMLIWKAVSAWTKGQNTEMGRTIIVGLIVATITFNLALPIQLAQSMGGLVSQAVSLLSNIAGGTADTGTGSVPRVSDAELADLLEGLDRRPTPEGGWGTRDPFDANCNPMETVCVSD